MKRVVFYFLIILAFCSRLICHHFYMLLIKAAHKSQGVKFEGFPEYIHTDAYLDPSGGLYIESGAVISTRTIVLTHDWSFLKRRQTGKYRAYHSVRIGNNTFVGAGAIILPGTMFIALFLNPSGSLHPLPDCCRTFIFRCCGNIPIFHLGRLHTDINPIQ